MKEAFWFIGKETKLTENIHFKNRVQFLGDKNNNCTLKINSLRESDAKEKYRFRFITNKGYSGEIVTLSLTGNTIRDILCLISGTC